MKKQVIVTATVTFIVQNSLSTNPGLSPLEILDSDGFREAYVHTLPEAEAYIRQIVEEALGLSGGIGLGNVTIETKDKE